MAKALQGDKPDQVSLHGFSLPRWLLYWHGGLSYHRSPLSLLFHSFLAVLLPMLYFYYRLLLRQILCFSLPLILPQRKSTLGALLLLLKRLKNHWIEENVHTLEERDLLWESWWVRWNSFFDFLPLVFDRVLRLDDFIFFLFYYFSFVPQIFFFFFYELFF